MMNWLEQAAEHFDGLQRNAETRWQAERAQEMANACREAAIVMRPAGRRRECGSGASQHPQARAEGIAHPQDQSGNNS
jgi:hypothetical protein